MHHTQNVDYSTGGRRRSETFRNVVLDVDVLFHETVPGLLICDENRKAVRQIQESLAQYSKKWIPQLFGRRRPGTQSESVSDSSSKVKVHKVTTGETFGAEKQLLRQIKDGLHVKFKSPQKSDVIIVFCPISSRVGSDVEAAMRKVSDNKKIILVVMHHTQNVDYSTGGRRWSETFRNVVLDVDVLFHETVPGLLICDENRKAIRQIQESLAQYSKKWIPQLFGWRRPGTQSESVSVSSSKGRNPD
ncbi:uncharacterized protein LOC133445544 [Cololabis saira]|uniref:uncharacterized protein LOC133445544 n=1 Tax=Cololabis saira TaxID=129043 RepID=UPI002AD2B861|nr:uncharacterized protein LOC133445544 [Cololabis saira]